MIRGNRWVDPRRPTVSTSLLCWRLILVATASPGGARPIQRRWQSHDQLNLSQRSPERRPGGPLALPFGGLPLGSRTPQPARPATRRQPRAGGSTGPSKQTKSNNPAFGAPPRPPPAHGKQGRPDREWSQLQRSPRRRDNAEPTRSAKSLGFEPISKMRGSDMPGKGNKDVSGFWAELESRVADTETSNRHRASGRPANGRSSRGPGLDHRNKTGRTNGRRADDWMDDEPRKASNHVAAAEDLPEYVSLGLDSLGGSSVNPLEHHRKGRRERYAEKMEKAKKAQNAKPKPQRRDRGFVDEDDDYEDVSERAEERRRRKAEKRRRKEMELAAAAQGPTPILLPEFISVGNLGAALRVKPHDFLRQLGELGFEDITLESIMTGETAALISQEYGFEPTVDTGESVDLKRRRPPEDPSTVAARPPIVTIMGHVDHGKTTMLDWLRKSSVAAQEHGGITQHIGAFSVRLSSGKQITFLDTPGHAAFLTMRQRGAHVTDIVILVVAADDSVKPQTLEALKHAREAKVPIIVAINKIDKDEARVDQVKSDLARHGVDIEDFGGDVQVVCVSGKTGRGMDDLEENILTLSEILDVRAEPDGMAEGWVLESSVKAGVGRSASVLVKRGTLRKGDVVAAGTTWARIRVLRNEAGTEVDEAPPGTPVEILGWRELPDAGDEVLQAPTEARAKEATDYRQEIREREQEAAAVEDQERREREKEAAAVAAEKAQSEGATGRADGTEHADGSAGTDGAAGDEAASRGPAVVNFTVKGDVMGSVEAVCAAINEIGSHEVRPQVLRSAPGPVTEFDVEHAAVTQSVIVNFNTPVPGLIKRKAKDAGVTILDHSVIYHLIDSVKDTLSEQLTPTISSRVLGEAEVLQVFPINLKGRLYKNIAGCRVRNGLVTRNGRYRVFRRGKKIFDGKLESLKQGKKDASEMRKGTECGIAFEEWGDMEVGDMIQAYEEIREKRSL